MSPRPEEAQIWAWLDAVPDPEIPVISVVDLGIVRNLRWVSLDSDEELVVAITPTYSGCPANTAIASDIEQALRQHGLGRVRIERQLMPPWTTDWMSERGREKLAEYGIAPPVGLAADGAPSVARQVACPQCHSARTSLVSRFGSTPCKAQFRCDDCLEPFEYFKCL